MKKFVLFSVVWMLIAFNQSVVAHSRLVHSSPADNESLTTSPSALHLEFNEDVRLLSLVLVGETQGEVSFGFQRNRQATDIFHFDLPNLADDAYRLTWTLLGADGHRVSGVVNFSVASEDERGS